ncbi:TetR/AcrR family transcriptional regulator [Zophobihabitans entericus]|uniref:TetR/AcrR family transcriptional regulator n=1 Tax=Zophobihabitans entericus TaxID=1635327 RepID=A0A6G9ICN8_9GAMM|nr:TetR/AcrR family transcriptional regulator [Zophobihabitans entericus]QIQ21998.1 TetR/AcrR family transcriptional regulator [Zophobihabitans entericus]
MKESKPLKTAEKILNAAEKLFAEYSYNEVSIRQITETAEVKLALAHYHFGSKEELYRTLIKRRIGILSRDRTQLLMKHKESYGKKAIPLEFIVESFIAPYLYNTLNGGDGWRDYAKLVARLLSSGSNLSLSILQEQFDPSAELFLAEIRKSAPKATEQQVQWGFDFLVGAMCNTFAEVDRINSLSSGLCSTEKPEVSCQYLFNFATAGLKAVLSQQPYDFTNTFSELTLIHTADNKKRK